jgi:hypothetical protein
MNLPATSFSSPVQSSGNSKFHFFSRLPCQGTSEVAKLLVSHDGDPREGGKVNSRALLIAPGYIERKGYKENLIKRRKKAYKRESLVRIPSAVLAVNYSRTSQ